jgi:hypothetical protein
MDSFLLLYRWRQGKKPNGRIKCRNCLLNPQVFLDLLEVDQSDTAFYGFIPEATILLLKSTSFLNDWYIVSPKA